MGAVVVDVVEDPFVDDSFVDRPDDTLDCGELAALFAAERFAASIARELIAPRAPRAVEDETRERTVATPRASFSCSCMGSREMNSFCSNWTMTYGRACKEWTFKPRA